MTTATSTNALDITQVVTAFAGRPDVSADEIVKLIREIRSELSSTTAMPAMNTAKPQMNNEQAPSAPQPAFPEEEAETPEASETDETEVSAEQDATSAPRATPVIPISESLTKDRMSCLICGKSMKMVKRHLGAAHSISFEEYKSMFDLPEDYPAAAPNFSAQKANFAKAIGFGKHERTKDD